MEYGYQQSCEVIANAIQTHNWRIQWPRDDCQNRVNSTMGKILDVHNSSDLS